MTRKNYNTYKIIDNSNPFLGPFFLSLNHLLRFILNIFKNSVFRLCPRTFHKFRIAILRIFSAKIGSYYVISQEIFLCTVCHDYNSKNFLCYEEK